jgi:hypothetical protein
VAQCCLSAVMETTCRGIGIRHAGIGPGHRPSSAHFLPQPDDNGTQMASRRFAAASLAAAILLVLAVGIRSSSPVAWLDVLARDLGSGTQSGASGPPALWLEQQPPLLHLLHFWLVGDPAFGRLLSNPRGGGRHWSCGAWRDLELRGPGSASSSRRAASCSGPHRTCGPMASRCTAATTWCS